MIILLTFLFLFSQQATELKVSNQWIRPGAKGMGTALYFEVENLTDSPDTLYKITSDISNMVQIHETYSNGDVMGMREIGEIIIEPESSVKLEPGGMHVMVMRLKRDIKRGDEIDFHFHFRNAGSIFIRAEAK